MRGHRGEERDTRWGRTICNWRESYVLTGVLVLRRWELVGAADDSHECAGIGRDRDEVCRRLVREKGLRLAHHLGGFARQLSWGELQLRVRGGEVVVKGRRWSCDGGPDHGGQKQSLRSHFCCLDGDLDSGNREMKEVRGVWKEEDKAWGLYFSRLNLPMLGQTTNSTYARRVEKNPLL